MHESQKRLESGQWGRAGIFGGRCGHSEQSHTW